MSSWRIALVMLVGGLILSGCNQTPRAARNAIIDYEVGDYAAAAAHLKPEIGQKNENYVLNNCRYGSCALAAGQLPEAENAFFNVYELMNATHVNDPGRTAGATVVFEGVKVWTGEPFERAMAHYYLGLIYLLKHDYGNARAAFQNSIFKVREYASKDDLDHYKAAESTFALGYFGLGYANLGMGNQELAQANFKLAQDKDPALAQVVADVQRPGVNTLIFVDAGRGPQREPKGWYNEESAFHPTPQEMGPAPFVIATVDGQTVTRPNVRYRMVDTLAMAQEQKWQDIDTIRKVKAAVGTGAMAAGAGMTAYGAEHKDKGFVIAGLASMALGAALAASSQSDLRYWEMLPRAVYIIPATLPPGEHDITVQAGGSRSAPLHTTVPPPAPGAPDNVLYFRLR